MLCRCFAPFKFLLLKLSSFFLLVLLSPLRFVSLLNTSHFSEIHFQYQKKFFNDFTDCPGNQIYFPGCKPCLHTCDQVGSLLACPEICQSGCSCKEKTFWNPRAMRCLEADACPGGLIRCFFAVFVWCHRTYYNITHYEVNNFRRYCRVGETHLL